jgi:hypothetical protein
MLPGVFELLPLKCPLHGREIAERSVCDGNARNGLLRGVEYKCGCRFSVMNSGADALKELSSGGPMPLGQLAESMDSNFQYVGIIVDWLRDKGLVTVEAESNGPSSAIISPTERGLVAGAKWMLIDEKRGPLIGELKELLGTEEELDEFTKEFLVPFMAYRMYRLLRRQRSILHRSVLKVPANEKEQKAAMKVELDERMNILRALFERQVAAADKAGHPLASMVDAVARTTRPDRTSTIERTYGMLQGNPATYQVMEAVFLYLHIKRRMDGIIL